MRYSTMDLYNVEPPHFDHMLRWESLKEMVKLSEARMKQIHDETSTMTYGCKEYDRLYEIYKTIGKAKKHNQDLLDERKQYDENKTHK